MNLSPDLKPYKIRKTWFIGAAQVAGWTLKHYGISAAGAGIDPAILEAAEVQLSQFKFPANSGHGWVVIHDGEHAVWLLVDLWVDDIVRHHLFFADKATPDQFQPGPDDGTMACVWELAVMEHERKAWIKWVLSRPHSPDFERYLQDVYEVEA